MKKFADQLLKIAVTSDDLNEEHTFKEVERALQMGADVNFEHNIALERASMFEPRGRWFKLDFLNLQNLIIQM